MPNVCFKVNVAERKGDFEDVYKPDGADDIDFMISANSGETLKQLSKVASGGELSRMMLAMKTVDSGTTNMPTMIFDEIDTGISGKTASKIGIRLRDLSKDQQVICVTHSAQVASSAEYHFRISKSEISGRTETAVSILDRDGRINEIARIMGGINITEKLVETAKELLDEYSSR